MFDGLILFLDYPGTLFFLLLAGGATGITIERLVENTRAAERRAYWRGRRQGSGKGRKQAGGGGATVHAIKALPDKPGFDAAEQLRIVMAADFAARPLLNFSERRVLTSLDRILAEDSPEWRAMCQVSLGEILASKQQDAFRAVNSKRVDFLIVDGNSRPLGVVEYQGGGHHQGTAAARDAVKKEALRRASIDYYEISAGDTPAELRAIIRKLAGRHGLQGSGHPRAPGA